jgi:hypothetical protein
VESSAPPSNQPKLARADDRSRRATARIAEAMPGAGRAPPRWHAGSARRASTLRRRSRTPRYRAASPRSVDHERPIRSGSLLGFASSESRSSPSGAPGVCPEPKSRRRRR